MYSAAGVQWRSRGPAYGPARVVEVESKYQVGLVWWLFAVPRTTSAHGTSVAIPPHSPCHTAITFEPLCSHIKPEGLTSSPLRGPTQWLVYNGTQWFRLYTTSPLRGSTRMLDAHPCPRTRGFGRGTMPLVVLSVLEYRHVMHGLYVTITS